jgi:hypothetical protein
MADVNKEIALKVTTNVDQTTNALQTAEFRLNEAKKAMIDLALAGKQGSKEFRELAIEAGTLKGKLELVEQTVDGIGKSTNKIEVFSGAVQGIAAGFAIAQGTAALFAEGNEELQKSLVRVQASLALLQGTEQAVQLLRKENAAGQALLTARTAAYNAVVGASTGALKLFRIALVSTGIGAAVVAIGLLVANWGKLTKAVTDFISGSPMLTKVIGYISDGFTSLGRAIGVIPSESEAATKQMIADLEKQQKLLEAAGANTTAIEKRLAELRIQLAKETGEGLAEAEQELTLFTAGEYAKRLEKDKEAAEKKAELDKAAAKNQAELNQELQKLRLENIQNAEKQSIAQLEIDRSQARRQLEDKKASDAVLIEFDKETQTQRNTIITQSQAELNKVTDSLRGENVSSEEAMALALLEVERSKARKLLEDKKASQELLAEFDKQSELQRKAITTQFELEKNQELETLRAQNIQNAEAQALALLEIERKKGRTELEIKGASAALLIEFDKQTEIQRKAITDQAQADRDAKAKEDNDKQIANAKVVADALQQARIDSIKNEFDRAQAELEIQRQAKIEELTLAGASAEEINAVNQSFADKSVQISKDQAAQQKAVKQAQIENDIALTLGGLQALSDLAASFAGQSEEQQKRAFAIQKGISIAMAVIETYLSASKAYTSQLTPGDPTSPFRAAFAAGIAIAAGLARVNAIRKTEFKSTAAPTNTGGGGGIPTNGGGQQQPPAAFSPNVTPTNPTGQPNPQGQGQQPLRAYVVDRDIENASSRRNMLRDFAAI